MNILIKLLTVFFCILEYDVFVCGNELNEETSDHKCTKIKRSEKLGTLYESGPCVLSYQARCGWFSLDLCTFYKKDICDKNSNVTQYFYSTIKVCCDGYIEDPNGTCVSLVSADPKWVIEQENNTDVVYDNIADIPKTTIKPKVHKSEQIVHTKEEESTLSKGALAGAACAAVFVIVVVGFIILGVYKRRRNNRAKKKPNNVKEDQDAGQMMLTTTT